MFPHCAVVTVMAFPPDALHTFTGTMPLSDFLSHISCSCFIITCSTYSYSLKEAQDLLGCRLFPMSNMPCFQTPKSFYHTCHSHHKMVASREGTLSPNSCMDLTRLNHFNIHLRPAVLRPSYLTFGVTYRLPDVCYSVVDQPCRSGIHTRWNTRPCPAVLLRDLRAFVVVEKNRAATPPE
jgi:hypothetical protein